MGSWFAHVKKYVAAHQQLNLHVVRYEDMLKVWEVFIRVCCCLLKAEPEVEPGCSWPTVTGPEGGGGEDLRFPGRRAVG